MKGIVTDTAGSNYNAAAGVSVIAGVDGTVASVDTAISAINNGTLTGQVPALGLVNALYSAQAAQTAFETSSTADVNALVAKLAAYAKFDNGDAATATQTDTLPAGSDYATKLAAIVADAKSFRDKVSADSTAVLTTKLGEAQAKVSTDYAALTAQGKAAATAYTNALTTQAGAKAADANLVVTAKAALDVDATATKGLAALGTKDVVTVTTPATYNPDGTANTPAVSTTTPGVPATAASVYTAYVNGTDAARSAIDTALTGSATYATFKALAVQDAALSDAGKAVTSTESALNAFTGSADYKADVAIQVGLTTKLAAAQKADADVSAVKVINDQENALIAAVTKAGVTDIGNFNDTNVAVKAVAITGSPAASATVKESFYFPTKVDGVDHTIGTAASQFGAGDSIVLGSGYTFNSGALSTGNNNALEFFLVKSDAGVQIVVESTVAGSTNATVSATAGVTTTAGATDTTSVITLTGVTLDHLSVANGVVSYV